jgi:thiamine kinase-like enzyme
LNTNIDRIIAQVPQWTGVKDLKVEPIGGLTNINYLVTAAGERYVLRVSGDNSVFLGINRELELEVLTTASDSGIGAALVQYILPEGHLVTRFIDGRHWTVAEYHRPEALQRLVETVKRIHAFPPTRGTFSPFRRVESYAEKARAFSIPFPADFDVFLRKMQAVEAHQQQDSSAWLRFCHNDLFSVNFLDDGHVRVVDWEFAGMGDIYFDLAALVYAYDSEGPLPAELEEFLLHSYFGVVNAAQRERLAGMKFMLLFFTAMWGLMQHGAQTVGILPPFEGFDCLAYAHDTFETLRGHLLKI